MIILGRIMRQGHEHTLIRHAYSIAREGRYNNHEGEKGDGSIDVLLGQHGGEEVVSGEDR